LVEAIAVTNGTAINILWSALAMVQGGFHVTLSLFAHKKGALGVRLF
jgi:hypothetical protein